MATPNFNLPEIVESQASKYLTHNLALRYLDALGTKVVEDFEINTPPASPPDGAVYVVGPSPTGSWVGNANKIAIYINTGWYFLEPWDYWEFVIRNNNQKMLFYQGEYYSLPILHKWSGNIVHTGTTAITTIYSVDIPTSFLSENSFIQITYSATANNNANAKNIGLSINSVFLINQPLVNTNIISVNVFGAVPLQNPERLFVLGRTTARTAAFTFSTPTDTIEITGELANPADNITLRGLQIKVQL